MKFTIFSVLVPALAVVASPTPEVHIAKRAFGPSPSTGEVCPQAQGLFYKTVSGAYYQVACSVDTSGGTNLSSYFVSNILDCAQKCDDWNKNKVAGQDSCYSGTIYPVSSGAIECLLKAGTSGWYAFEVSPTTGTESVMLSY